MGEQLIGREASRSPSHRLEREWKAIKPTNDLRDRALVIGAPR